MPYDMQINAGVTGVDQVERLGAATEQQTARTTRLNEAIQQYMLSNDKLLEKYVQMQAQEVRLESLREQHRMQTERLAAAESLLAKGIEESTVAAIVGARAQDGLASSTGRMTSSTMAATAALRELEGGMSIRAAGNFLMTIQGVGTALQAAFPLVGAVALLGVLDQMGNKLGIHLDFWNDIARAQKDSHAELQKATAEYDRQLQQLKEIQKQERRRSLIAKDPKNGAMMADVADATDVGDVSSISSRVQSLRQDLDSLRRMASPTKLLPLRPEDMVRAGLMGVDTIGEAEARIPDTQKALIAAEAGLRTAMEQLRLDGEKVDEDIAKKREEANRKSLQVEQQIAELRKRGLEAYEAAALGNNPIARAMAAQSKVGIDKADEIRRLTAEGRPLTAQERTDVDLAFFYRGLAASADLQAAINKDAHDRAERIKDVPMPWDRMEMLKAMRLDVREGQEDPDSIFSFRATLPRIPPPPGYRSPEQQLRDSRDDERRFFGTFRASAALSGMPEGDQVEATYQARLHFADEEMKAQLRIADAKKDIAAREDALDEAQQKRYDAALEREQALLEIAVKEKDQFASTVVGLVGAARSGGSAGVGRFFMGELNKIEDTVVGNLARMAYGDPTKGTGLSGLIPHAQSGFLSKLLQGTAFGPDPLKSAGLTLSAAGAKLDLAAQHLLSISSTGGGGGLVRGAASVAGSATAGFGGGGYVDPTTGDYINENGDDLTAALGDFNTLDSGLGAPMGGMPSWAGSSAGSATSSLAKVAGVAGGAFMGYQGISNILKGGTQNAIGGTGELLSGIGAILPAISSSLAIAGPIGMIAGLGLGFISSMIGDPKQNRENQISRTLQMGQYIAPVSINAAMSTSGTYMDYDRFGGLRSSDLSPFPTIQSGYLDPWNHNTIIPGRTTSSFGAPTGGTTVNISALDAKSILDRHMDIADAVLLALDRGTPLGERIQHS
jgi:hypothetical protein